MGALEAEILAALWASDDAMTPGDVRQVLDADLAYTTVMTILTRLWDKELVVREARGRAYAYRPALSEAELVARRLQATLEGVVDRRGALVHFVGTLAPGDEQALRRILGKAGRKRSAPGASAALP
jgi:predicted transcriptional regulator